MGSLSQKYRKESNTVQITNHQAVMIMFLAMAAATPLSSKHLPAIQPELICAEISASHVRNEAFTDFEEKYVHQTQINPARLLTSQTQFMGAYIIYRGINHVLCCPAGGSYYEQLIHRLS